MGMGQVRIMPVALVCSAAAVLTLTSCMASQPGNPETTDLYCSLPQILAQQGPNKAASIAAQVDMDSLSSRAHRDAQEVEETALALLQRETPGRRARFEKAVGRIADDCS